MCVNIDTNDCETEGPNGEVVCLNCEPDITDQDTDVVPAAQPAVIASQDS